MRNSEETFQIVLVCQRYLLSLETELITKRRRDRMH
jgi:hypothetical protein